jgi:cation diffusion facilitator CzcD-associated flavoprotein CzcO
VPVETKKEVQTIVRDGTQWRATLGDGEVIDARAVVLATGIVSNPRVPTLAGASEYRGRLMHSVEYQRPREFVSKRVLVIGVGNSGGEIGSELGEAGARVTMLVRSGAHVVPRDIGGIPMQYLARVVRALPKGMQGVVLRQVQRMTVRKRGAPVIPPKSGSPLDTIPIIGFHLVDAIKSGQVALKLGALERLTASGARFADGTEEDFDVVILATGFDAAMAPLGPLVRRDAKGFALRNGRVASADQPALWFVGHNYDSSGGIANIRRDSGLAAEEIAQLLRQRA